MQHFTGIKSLDLVTKGCFLQYKRANVCKFLMLEKSYLFDYKGFLNALCVKLLHFLLYCWMKS